MSPENSQSHLISGSRSAVELVIGDGSTGNKAPLVIGSVPSGMDAVTAGVVLDDKTLKPAIRWMNSVDSGAWMALAESAGRNARPTLIVQNNASRFHRERYDTWPGSDKVWRDWWFATLFCAIDQLDTTWGQDEIVVWHPVSSSNPWGSQMIGALVEVVAHLADNRDLKVQRIALGCPHGMTAGSLASTERMVRETASPLRDPVHLEVAPTDVGCPAIAGLRLIKVEVPEFGSSTAR